MGLWALTYHADVVRRVTMSQGTGHMLRAACQTAGDCDRDGFASAVVLGYGPDDKAVVGWSRCPAVSPMPPTTYAVDQVQTDSGQEFDQTFHWHQLDNGIGHVEGRPHTGCLRTTRQRREVP